ncbi:hypothetical protein GW796_07395 [archaeon]|nr:hypothetical protein [archaeon]NCQ51708.1 hypothetical protein [archaeon]
MATKQKTAVASPTKSTGNTINRFRRNAATRKCLPKQFKVLFAGASRPEFKAMFLAWQDGRKKVKATD